MQINNSAKGIDTIGRELVVAYVLEGSVRRGDDRLRVTARLIDVSAQSHVWSESYDRNIGDMLTVQSELARAIADAIRVQLTPQQQQRLTRPAAVSPAAHEAYLMGRYFWNRRTRESLVKAEQHFERAIENNPDYAAAYAGLAD